MPGKPKTAPCPCVAAQTKQKKPRYALDWLTSTILATLFALCIHPLVALGFLGFLLVLWVLGHVWRRWFAPRPPVVSCAH